MSGADFDPSQHVWCA